MMKPGMPGSKAKPAVAVQWFADHVMEGVGETPTLALGPLVWNIEPGHDTRQWYFVAASLDAEGEIRLDQFRIGMDDPALAEKCRAILMLELIQRRPPCVLSDFDDELAMARWCEALCPCERTRRIRENCEQERRP
jgi:hypothetical protein